MTYDPGSSGALAYSEAARKWPTEELFSEPAATRTG